MPALQLSFQYKKKTFLHLQVCMKDLWFAQISIKTTNKQIVHYHFMKCIMCNFFIFLILWLCAASVKNLVTSSIQWTEITEEYTILCLKTWGGWTQEWGDNNFVRMILLPQLHFLQLHRIAFLCMNEGESARNLPLILFSARFPIITLH